MSGLQIGWYDRQGVCVRYAQRKLRHDETPLLVFNGIGQNLETLTPLLDRLQAHSIITLDIPGVGLSETPALPWRYRHYASCAKALVDNLGYRRVNVLGISWGGGLAQQYALQFPNNTVRLILAAAAPGSLMIPGNPRVYAMMGDPRRFVSKRHVIESAGAIYGGDLRQNADAALQMMSAQIPPPKKGYLYQVMAMYGWSKLLSLRNLKNDALIMHGADDPMIPAANARILARAIPNARLEMFDCGHLFPLTRVDRAASLITAFLDED